jgi:hypothetical protein
MQKRVISSRVARKVLIITNTKSKRLRLIVFLVIALTLGILAGAVAAGRLKLGIF